MLTKVINPQEELKVKSIIDSIGISRKFFNILSLADKTLLREFFNKNYDPNDLILIDESVYLITEPHELDFPYTPVYDSDMLINFITEKSDSFAIEFDGKKGYVKVYSKDNKAEVLSHSERLLEILWLYTISVLHEIQNKKREVVSCFLQTQ